ITFNYFGRGAVSQADFDPARLQFAVLAHHPYDARLAFQHRRARGSIVSLAAALLLSGLLLSGLLSALSTCGISIVALLPALPVLSLSTSPTSIATTVAIAAQ